MEMTIFWFQKGHVSYAAQASAKEGFFISGGKWEVLQMENHRLFEVPLKVAYSLV